MTVLAAGGLLLRVGSQARQRFAAAALAAGLIGGALGASAYSIATIGQAHTGGMAVVGPAHPQLEAMLRATHNDFSAAIDRSNAAAGLELSTDTAVMAIGGFGGSDPVPTLGEFQQDVATHRIGYYVAPSQDHRVGHRVRPRRAHEVTRPVSGSSRGAASVGCLACHSPPEMRSPATSSCDCWGRAPWARSIWPITLGCHAKMR